MMLVRRSPRWARIEDIFAMAVVVWGVIGAFVLLTGRLKAELALSTAVYLILGGVYASIALARRLGSGVGIACLVFTAVIGFYSEVIGVKTGWPYGHYTYTSYLAPDVWHVPIVMMAAWLFITVESFVVVPAHWPWVTRVVLGGLVAVGIDMLIDPVAANVQHLWRWQQRGAYYHIPLQNFVAWFAIECLLQAVLVAVDRRSRPVRLRKLEFPLFALVLVFTVPALKQGWIWPVVFSLCPWLFTYLFAKWGVRDA